MAEMDQGLHRQQNLYWSKMVELKVAASYMRCYRDYLGRWVTRIGVVRAVASSSSIAAWAIWRDYAFLWGAIIAVSQVLDALKDVFPVTKRFKAASEHVVALDSLFIDAQLEWESVFSGAYTDAQIMTRLHKLRKLQHEAECRSFKDGLPLREDLFKQAESEAGTFFRQTYGVHSIAGGNDE
jgi:hypothetical protein